VIGNVVERCGRGHKGKLTFFYEDVDDNDDVHHCHDDDDDDDDDDHDNEVAAHDVNHQGEMIL